MSVKRRTLIDGIYLTYYEMGKGQTILFLHGGRLRAKTFQSTIESLSNNFHVIAPDIPGYGNSSTPRADWTYRDYAIFFNKFINFFEKKTNIYSGGNAFTTTLFFTVFLKYTYHNNLIFLRHTTFYK